jgi:predicted Fe-Mo cluster-binding NifX family protein
MMNYVLMVVIASNIQSVGVYGDQSACQKAAKDFQSQGVKAVCVQQESPEQAITKMTALMKTMMEQMNNGNRN